MRQRVEIQALVETANTYGQLDKSWTKVASPASDGLWWAEVLTIGGGEQPNANQVKAESTHTVRLRYAGQIAGPTIRIVFVDAASKTRVFDVLNLKDVDFRNREYRLSCREIVSTS